MAIYNIEGSKEGCKNGQLVTGDDDYCFDDLLLNNSTDQETDPEQNLQQEFDLPAGPNVFFPSLWANQGRQAASGALLCLKKQFRRPLGTNKFLPSFFPKSTMNKGSPSASGTQPWPQQQLDQPAGPNGCLPEPWINQGQGNQAAAATQYSLIEQEYSGQSPVIFTGDSHSQRKSAPDSLLRKRGYDKTYREKVKKHKQGLEDENIRLKLEKHEFEEQIKSALEAYEAENGRLKHEFEEQMKSKLDALEAENGRLKLEKHEFVEQMKSKLDAFEAENGRLKREKHEFKEQIMSKLEAFEAENGRLKHEIQEKEQQMKFNLETEFEIKRLRDEIDSLKRDNAWLNQRMQTQSKEVTQLRKKFDKFELNQQNQRTTENRGMSSTEEFGVRIQENDPVDSAQNIPIISEAKEAVLAREGEIDKPHLNGQDQMQKAIEAEVNNWTRQRPRQNFKFKSYDI